MAKERAQYTKYQRDQVLQRYHLCRNTADRKAFAEELGFDSLAKLYNLASRLGATGKKTMGGNSWSAVYEENKEMRHEDPDTTKMTPADKRYLINEFGKRTPEAIAFHRHHTETAIAYWARHLELRKPAKVWNIIKVSKWLNVTEEELLDNSYLDIHPLSNKKFRVVIKVVSTTSLARWLQNEDVLADLRARHADEFFIREIQESTQDILDKKVEFEHCKFLSHGHVCQNPRATASFGWYCTNTDIDPAGADRNCRARFLEIEDLRPPLHAEKS